MNKGERVAKWIKAQKLTGVPDTEIKDELIIASRIFPDALNNYTSEKIDAVSAFSAIQRMRKYGIFVQEHENLVDFDLQ